MALPQDFLMELKYRNDIESVLSPYMALKRRGRNLVGLCPFHNEKTPSFTVYPENGSYYCFGCGQGGDIITFVMRAENLDYIDAVKRLADRAGLKMPENDFDDREQKLRNDIYEVNREAAKFYHNCLMSPLGKDCLEYYLGRGLSLKTITHFGLGYAPNDWRMLYSHLRDKGFSHTVIAAADLVSVSEKKSADGKSYFFDRFRNRAMFPIINIHGKVIAFSGRAMPGEDKRYGKYVNTSDTPVYKKSNNIYGINFAKKVCQERVILVEGNIDVVSLHQAGFENAVAALGTSFTEEQARLLARYTKEVLVVLDADEAGEKATDRTMKILSRVGLEARIIRLPDCKDPDEYVRKHGGGKFAALIDGAISDIEYKLYMAAKDVDLDADDGRLQYLKKACEVLAELDDPIAVDLYASRLSDKYNVSKQVLLSNTREMVEKRKKQRYKKELGEIVLQPKSDSVNPQKQQLRRAVAAEETVISVLIKHPDLFESTYSSLKPEDMITDFSRRLYSRVADILLSGASFDLILLGEDFTPDEVGYISRLLTVSAQPIEPKRTISDALSVIFNEKEKLSRASAEDMTDEEWAAEMLRQAKNKKAKNMGE